MKIKTREGGGQHRNGLYVAKVGAKTAWLTINFQGFFFSVLYLGQNESATRDRILDCPGFFSKAVRPASIMSCQDLQKTRIEPKAGFLWDRVLLALSTEPHILSQLPFYTRRQRGKTSTESFLRTHFWFVCTAESGRELGDECNHTLRYILGKHLQNNKLVNDWTCIFLTLVIFIISIHLIFYEVWKGNCKRIKRKTYMTLHFVPAR